MHKKLLTRVRFTNVFVLRQCCEGLELGLLSYRQVSLSVISCQVCLSSVIRSTA